MYFFNFAFILKIINIFKNKIIKICILEIHGSHLGRDN